MSKKDFTEEVKVLACSTIELTDISQLEVRRIIYKNKKYLVIQNMYKTHAGADNWQFGKGIWLPEKDNIAKEVIFQATELLEQKL